MTERPLTVDSERPGGFSYGRLRVDGRSIPIHNRAARDSIAAELDRLYAAAEANQAPGPDWKAKLREEVEAERRPGSVEFAWFLELIDALPDPLTPDPDAPPVYVPPEGHYAPVLGKDVPDGWEGQLLNSRTDSWWTAYQCSENPTTLFEVRRVPAPEPATEWVPLTKLVGRTIKGCDVAVYKADVTEYGQGWWALHDLIQDRRSFPDGTLDLDTAQVLVLVHTRRRNPMQTSPDHPALNRRQRRHPHAEEPQFLTAVELAARWGVSKQHIYNLLHKGLPSVTIGGRARRFRTDQVDAWIEAKSAEGKRS